MSGASARPSEAAGAKDAGRLAVAWHDIECGGYHVDLPLWRELASRQGAPVLDVGAGTGRVALDLARAGFDVVALDHDPTLLAAVRERGDGLPVETAHADARDFDLDRRFPLILAPMQTVQLLGGKDGRAGFLAAAVRHLEPGGLLAAALADPLEPFDAERDGEPEPDVGDLDGLRLASRPVAIRDEGDRVALVRIREVDGRGTEDVVHLDRLRPRAFEREARAHGLKAERRRVIAPTGEHTGSVVVLLRG